MIIDTDDGGTVNTHRGEYTPPETPVEVEFRNVTITLANVRDAREAYAQLCNLLAVAGQHGVVLEYSTDTFVEYANGIETPARSTEILMPTESE